MEGDRKSAAAAFFLSVVPGLGHLYVGRVGSGLGWLVVVFMLYPRVAPVAMVLHFICAASAARAAEAANRQEREEIKGRRESATDVARILDEAVRRGPASDSSSAAPTGPVGDPPPRLMRAAFPVPATALVEGLARGMQTAGLLVLGVDRKRMRVRGSADLGGGLFTTAVAQVEETPSGSRVRLMVDRPEGSPLSPERDDAILREILQRTEAALTADGLSAVDPSAARSAPIVGEGEALTEDHFLQQLREAWESWDQGWLPDEEWAERKRSLLSSVELRHATRFSDFMAVCRPLVEGGVLEPDDLRLLEARLR